ncbi:MAG: glycosyltransferase [Lachnospiraceae bacterium]|nr:glycosyltransferase [Lachnospiraceae bacterium]
MKRVLWVCNIMLPVIAEELGLPYSNREGWLSGIFQQLLEEKEKQIELGICFPVTSLPDQLKGQGNKPFRVKGVPCYGLVENLNTPEVYDASLEDRFSEILADFQPDMIHIFGTEFPHALAAVKVFDKPEKTLVGIQGLCGEIAKAYMAGLPEKVQGSVTFRDLLRQDSIRQQQEKFEARGRQEAEIIRGTGNITGRTVFDKAGTAKMNPKAQYFHMNETMRREFYTGQWDAKACEPYSIFLSQGDYPLKGMHFALEALAKLLPRFPEAKLYVAGNSIIEQKNFKQKLKLSAYGKYLLQIISRYHLEDKVIVTGKLTAEEMKQQFLKSSVFICPSVLENSPNTVGEAMLLGVPVVASQTGGIPDMIKDGEEGLLVPVGDVDKLAEAIAAMWTEDAGNDGEQQTDCGGDSKPQEAGRKKAEDTLAKRLSHAAARRARITHDGNANYKRLLEIYDSILNQE